MLTGCDLGDYLFNTPAKYRKQMKLKFQKYELVSDKDGARISPLTQRKAPFTTLCSRNSRHLTGRSA